MNTNSQRLSKNQLNTILLNDVLPLFKRHPSYAWYEKKGLDDRVILYLDLLNQEGLLSPGIRLLDLGAGLSFLPVFLQRLGLQVSLVDSFEGGGGMMKGEEGICR